MGKQKPDFKETQQNPFVHNMAAAAEILGFRPVDKSAKSETASEPKTEPTPEPESQAVTETAPTSEQKTEPVTEQQPESVKNPDTALDNKKTREARDKENGKQHIHIILPKYQADALKKMAISYGLTVTNFMQETIEMHLNGDWKARLEQMQLNQKKMEFKKEEFVGIEPINK